MEGPGAFNYEKGLREVVLDSGWSEDRNGVEKLLNHERCSWSFETRKDLLDTALREEQSLKSFSHRCTKFLVSGKMVQCVPINEWRSSLLSHDVLGHALVKKAEAKVRDLFIWKLLEALLPRSRDDQLHHRLWAMFTEALGGPLNPYGEYATIIFFNTFSSGFARTLKELYPTISWADLDDDSGVFLNSEHAQNYSLDNCDESDLGPACQGILQAPASRAVRMRALELGGDIDSALGVEMTVQGLKWQLELERPPSWSDNRLWKAVLQSQADQLQKIRVLHSHGIPLPKPAGRMFYTAGPDARVALFSFGYVDHLPAGPEVTDLTLWWNEVTRCYFSPSTKNLAVLLHLIFMRAGLPRDLRNMFVDFAMVTHLEDMETKTCGEWDCRAVFI